MNTQQAYQILVLPDNASFEDIKYSYRKLALELHPDKNKNQSDVKFKKITEAYHFLKKQNKQNNSKNINRENYTVKDNPKQKFYTKSDWESNKEDKSPQEDWSRFTREFEEDKDLWKEYEKKFWNEYESTLNNDPKNEEPQEFKTSTNKVKLNVNVDKTLCIGCCSCETIAPGVFTVNKQSQMNPKSRVYNKSGASNLKIINAAETCPTKAIIVDDLTNGERVFPY